MWKEESLELERISQKTEFHGFQPWMTSEISINTYCTLSNSRKLNVTQQHSVLSVQAPPSRMYSWLIIVPKRSSDIAEGNISNFDGYSMNPRSFHVLKTCFLDVKFQFALCIIKHGLGVILLLLTTVNMQDLIFSLWRLWTGYQCVTLCSLLCTYRCFRGTCCLFLQGSETRQHVLVKCLYVSTVLQCNGSLKVAIFN